MHPLPATSLNCFFVSGHAVSTLSLSAPHVRLPSRRFSDVRDTPLLLVVRRCLLYWRTIRRGNAVSPLLASSPFLHRCPTVDVGFFLDGVRPFRLSVEKLFASAACKF